MISKPYNVQVRQELSVIMSKHLAFLCPSATPAANSGPLIPLFLQIFNPPPPLPPPHTLRTWTLLSKAMLTQSQSAGDHVMLLTSASAV